MKRKTTLVLLTFIILVTSSLILYYQAYQAGPEEDDFSGKETHLNYSQIPDLKGDITLGYTHILPDGNRFIEGQGSFPDSEYLDISLEGRPQWIAALTLNNSIFWVAVLDDGKVQAFMIRENNVQSVPIKPNRIQATMPPLLVASEGFLGALDPPSSTATEITHPVVLKSSRRIAFIDQNADIVFWEEGEIERLDVDALPDARLLMDEDERVLLLTGPTTRYRHGVLGDRVEASGFTLIDTRPGPEINMSISLQEQVIEGISPIWADLDGDSTREIIVTASDSQNGAQILVFDETGKQIASGHAIGKGDRWRHQIAVAPFGPDGETELVDVLTPHIGGVVEFYRLEGDELKVVAQIGGYTSHIIGSRNLDMAAAGDFDGDGKVELLLPEQSLTKLGGIRHTRSGAEVAWTVDVGGKVSTNIAGATLSDGGMAVGIGRSDGILRVWID